MKKLIALVVVAVVLATQVPNTFAAPMLSRWPSLPLTYMFKNINICNQIGMTTAIRTAMHEWETWLNTTIFTPNPPENQTQILYICFPQSYATIGDLESLGDANANQQVPPGAVVPALTMLFSSGVNRTVTTYAEVLFWAYAIQSPVNIAAHELGNTLGLKEDLSSSCNISIVCAVQRKGDPLRQPTPDEINTLKAVYSIPVSSSQVVPPPSSVGPLQGKQTEKPTPLETSPPLLENVTVTAPPSSTAGSFPLQAGQGQSFIAKIVNVSNLPYVALTFGIFLMVLVVRRRRERKREATQIPLGITPPSPKTSTDDEVRGVSTLPPLHEMEERYRKTLPAQATQPAQETLQQAQLPKTVQPSGPRRYASGYLSKVTRTSTGILVAEIVPTYITADPVQTCFPVTAEATEKVLAQQAVDEATNKQGIVDFTIQDGFIVDVKRRPTLLTDNIPERRHIPNYNCRGAITPIFSPFDPRTGDAFECLLRSICMLEDLDWAQVLERKEGLDNWRKGWSLCAELAPWALDGFRWAANTTNWKALHPTLELLLKMRGRGLIIFAHPDLPKSARPDAQHVVAYEAGYIYDPYNLGQSPETLDVVLARWSPERGWYIRVLIPQPFTFDDDDYARTELELTTRHILESAHGQQRYCRHCGSHLASNLFCPRCQMFIGPEYGG
jgi:hypothetical protein